MLDTAKAQLAGGGADVRTAVADVTDEEQVAAAVEAAKGPEGQLHAVVANAGMGTGAPITLMTADMLRSVFEPNVIGVFNTVKQSAIAMQAGPTGLLELRGTQGSGKRPQDALAVVFVECRIDLQRRGMRSKCVRDELRDGRPLVGAVEAGWKRAFRTILASKGVNLLAAIVLFILAVGSVKGFAYTLGLTTIIDVIVVILFTHPMLQLLAQTKFFSSGNPWSGLDPNALGAVYRGRAEFRKGQG